MKYIDEFKDPNLGMGGDKSPTATDVGMGFVRLILKIALLFLGSISGSLIANKGIHLYFTGSGTHGGSTTVVVPLPWEVPPTVSVTTAVLSSLPLLASRVCAASKLPSRAAPYQILSSALASLALMQVAVSVLLPVTPMPASPEHSAAASRAGS